MTDKFLANRSVAVARARRALAKILGIINGKAWILANARIALAKILGETRVALARANSQLKSSSGANSQLKFWAKQE